MAAHDVDSGTQCQLHLRVAQSATSRVGWLGLRSCPEFQKGKNMKALLLPFVLASAASLGMAADSPSVSGTWQLHQSIADNESDSSCTFTQNDQDLTGSCHSENGSGNITGKVDGKKVTWVYKSQYNGGPITLTYQGTLVADKMTGTVTVAEYSVDGDFTATKAGK